MKLKFKKQQYQEDAANSVVKCFEGQTKGEIKIHSEIKMLANEGTTWERIIKQPVVTFGNKKIELSNQELRRNIRNVQKQNNLEFTDDKGYENYSIEMETGTGKTYTYIKTMYELNKNYGWSKFIVMVPSIAIREGVLKSFQITEDHFQEIYHKKIRYFIYNSSNSSNLSNINSFAEDSSIQVMIINYQAFSARTQANRRIYEEIDDLQSKKPIDVLKSTNPILIIDEPQKFGEQTEKMLKEFNPLFILRYSATHKKDKEYNKIYRIDAIDAYNKNLVKKINVKGIEIIDSKSENAYLYLEGVEISKQAPKAIIEIEQRSGTGVKKVSKTLKRGDNIYKISGNLEQYKGYTISDIDATDENYDKVTFTNGVEIKTGQVLGDAKKNYLTRIQIRETIKAHFEKEKEYYKLGIKVLSLFFIDEVAKYKKYDENKMPYNGEYAKIFEEEYHNIFDKYYDEADEYYKRYLIYLKNKKVHAGYFSIDKKAAVNNEIIYVDSQIDDKYNGTSSDVNAYDLIMKDKERLLSLEEPVRFIFSHSALREGWDNPNIFQICTLKNNNSEISKRQEIGRGLRICVNKNGDRMDYATLEESFHEINSLTIIASESYQNFSKSLQDEIAQSLVNREMKFTQNMFIGKIFTGENGEKLEFTENLYQDFIFDNVEQGYIDRKNNYKVTEKFLQDLEKQNLQLQEELEPFRMQITELLKKIFLNKKYVIGNENKINIKKLEPNNNFYKKEFQELLEKIRTKTVYEVNFNSEELIENSIEALNMNLIVPKMKVRITQGEQKEKISIEELKSNTSMEETKKEIEFTNSDAPVQVEYDLIGTISKETELTRKTIIKILSNIKEDVFNQYKYNPEEFIIKASNIINDEKADIVIKNIKYKKIDQKFNDSIFTINKVQGNIGNNVIEVKKNIYDYLITDSVVEREFAKELELQEDVIVYAKLPSKFKIPTPVGNYNPDWAIVMNKSKFKDVYVIVETKGTSKNKQLRGVENAKKECAIRHFKEISNNEVSYNLVNTYDELINKLKRK